MDSDNMQTTSNHKKFSMRVKSDHNKRIEGILSWNGSRNDLDTILDETLANQNTAKVKVDSVLDDSVDHVTPKVTDPDPFGASSFVIAVVLLYGFSIVFLIASHVFIKRKGHPGDSEKQINKYLEQVTQLKDAGQKESFKKLKKSLIPVIAQSPSGRAMIAKRVKYTPYLVQYLPFTALTAGNPEGGEERLSAIMEQGSQRSLLFLPSHRTINVIDQRKPYSSRSDLNADAVVHDRRGDSDDVSDDVSVSSEEHDTHALEKYLYGDRSLDEILEEDIISLSRDETVRTSSLSQETFV